jgi:hypothetical protein
MEEGYRMAPEELASRLWFRPWPHGDPGPEIWQIINELQPPQQREIVGAILRSQIAMEEARISGLKQVADLISKAR